MTSFKRYNFHPLSVTPDRPCTAYFTVPDNTTTTKEIFDGFIRDGIPANAVRCLQHVPNNGVVVTFASPEYRNKFLSKSVFVVRNKSILVHHPSRRVTYVNVYDAPYELPDSTVETRLAAYGSVLSVRCGKCQEMPDVFNSVRHVNCYDNSLDKFGGNPVLSVEFSLLTSNFGLDDAWRFKNQRMSQFTWFNAALTIGSRLDTFLVSRNLRDCIQSCEICPCTFSDHKFVFLNINLSSFVPHGPGMWKFNNSLLANEAFCQNIRSTIDVFSSFEHTFLSVVDFWEALKQDFKQISIEFSQYLTWSGA